MEALNFNQLSIYDHFNIFDDLFIPGAYFKNTQKFVVKFGENSIQRGNLLTAAATSSEPRFEIESLGSNAYNSVIMLNMDGDAFTQAKEDDVDKTQLLHWFVANIPDGKADGETIVPYLPPTPFKGTGFHRIAFVLFRHKERIDFGDVKIQGLVSYQLLVLVIFGHVFELNFGLAN